MHAKKAGEEPGNGGLVRQLDFGFPFTSLSLVRLKDAFRGQMRPSPSPVEEKWISQV